MVSLLSGTSNADFENAGFETGDFTGWTLGGRTDDSGVGMDGDAITGVGAVYAPASINVRSGSYAAKAVVAHGNDPLEFFSLSQMVDLTAGAYQIGFYLGTDANQNPGMEAATQDGSFGVYVDSVLMPFTVSGATESGFLVNGSTPADMHHFASEFEAEEGSALIELRISGSASSRAGLSIDDAYVVSLEAPELSGDYNSDSVVDAADYAVWRESLGDTGLPIFSGADGDGDGLVGAGDYTVWRDNYGSSAGASLTASPEAAPEPQAALLAALCLLLGIGPRPANEG